MMRSFVAVLLLSLFVLVSCAQELDGPNTQVMLRVYNEDALLRMSMTHLKVSFALREHDQRTWLIYPDKLFPKGVLEWPVDIPIVPAMQDDDKHFEVVVEVLDGTTVLAQQRAVTAFEPGGLRLLELWLYRCPGRDSPTSCAPSGCQHETCGVCKLDGNCGGSYIDPGKLAGFHLDEDPVSRPPPGFTGGTQSGASGEGGAPINLDGGVVMGPGGNPGSTGGMAGPAGTVMTDAGGTSIGAPGGMGFIDAGMTGGGLPAGLLDGGPPKDGGGGSFAGATDAGAREAGTGVNWDASTMDATVREAGLDAAGAIGGSGGTTGGAGGTTGGLIGGSGGTTGGAGGTTGGLFGGLGTTGGGGGFTGAGP